MHGRHDSDEELLLCEHMRADQSFLNIERSRPHCILVTTATLLRLGVQFDEVVDTKDSDGGFSGKLEALCLHHGGLVHASLTVVSGLAIDQVQTNPTRQNVVVKYRVFYITRVNQAAENLKEN